jgi:hypothetical protein
MDFDRSSSKPFGRSFHNPDCKLGPSQRRVAHPNPKSWILEFQLLADEGPNIHRPAPPSMRGYSYYDVPDDLPNQLPDWGFDIKHEFRSFRRLCQFVVLESKLLRTGLHRRALYDSESIRSVDLERKHSHY